MQTSAIDREFIPAQVFPISSPEARLLGAGAALAWGLIPFGLTPVASNRLSIVFCLIWLLPMAFVAWGSLTRANEVQILGSRGIRLVNIFGVRDVMAGDIERIVRKERPRGGNLDHINIRLRTGGTITIPTSKEEIFRALTRLAPTAQVSHEVYDPD